MPEPVPDVPPARMLFVLASSGGGVGRHVAELAGAFAPDATVAGPAATDAAFGFSALARFVAVEISDRPRPAADLAAARRLRSLLGATDVAHAHGLRAGALTVLAARTLPPSRRPPVMVTLHNALVSGGAIAVVHGVLTLLVARGADAVLVVSGDLATSMRTRGARRVTRALVPAPPLPVATRSRDDVRAGFGVPPRAALLVTVARLAPQKGLTHLVDAVRLLSCSGVPPGDAPVPPGDATVLPGTSAVPSGDAATPRVFAVVAGEGPLRAELETAARGLPLALPGARDDVADLLAAADVVLVPSLWEGQPLIVQEALRAGAALVATDAGGTAAVAGDGAVLVPPGDARALADAVAALLDDPGAAAALRARAVAAARGLPTAADAARQVRELASDLRHPV